MLITFAINQVYDSAFAYAREKWRKGLFYALFLAFAHRALAAFRALRFRCSSVMVSSLRLPPILPPLAPISRMTIVRVIILRPRAIVFVQDPSYWLGEIEIVSATGDGRR